MASQRLLSLLALCASFFALCVIELGAFTRLIDAGLGCPDWPGCYGYLTVPLSEKAQALATMQYPNLPFDVYKAWAEMIHRYFAGSLGFFILAIVILIFKKELRQLSNIVLASGLVLLLVYQILLGQWTVTYKLLPIIVSQHLLGGFLILTFLWLIYLNNRVSSFSREPTIPRWCFPAAIVALILLFLQIALGAWTSTNYAALSCPDFPFCFNTSPLFSMHFSEAFNLFLPIGLNYEGGVLSEYARQTIHIMHRIGALIFTTYLLIFTVVTARLLKNHFGLIKLLYVIWGLVSLQLCIGIINVLYQLPLATAVAHNLTAALLLLAMVTFLYRLAIESKR